MIRKDHRGTKVVKENRSGFNSFEDVAEIAKLIMEESKSDLANASRILSKLIVVTVLGFTLASNCCLARGLVPVGIAILAMAAGWLDVIGNECSCQRFYPSQSLNFLGKYLFRWQWVVMWTCILFTLSHVPLCVPSKLAYLLQLSLSERLWIVCKLAGIPLALMLACRALEPFRFRRARAEIKKAELLLRQLAAKRTSVDFAKLAPLIEPDVIPLYKLGSVAKVLCDFVASYDAKEKMKVDISEGQSPDSRWSLQRLLSLPYYPFRTIANNLLLWESRDIVLYIAAGIYFSLAYMSYDYLSWAPLVVFVPFVGPKSRAGRYVRALQENIRLAQGQNAEKKGGMAPAWMPQDTTTLNIPMIIYITSSHLGALYALLVLFVFGGACPFFGSGVAMKNETLVMGAILYFISGLGITAGAHRLWSHRSYKAAAPLRLVLMLFNSVANQGTIFHWSRDHRVHHLYSDTAADPHDANRGFFFSHVGWLLTKKSKAVIEAGKKINIKDLEADPIVMFQKRADPFWNLIWCFGLPSFLALAWGDSLWNGFLIGGVLRYVLMLNATWAVNSVVHAYGNRPYNPAHLTTENGWVSLFAIGEGWHNWHHAFAYDYVAAELGALSQFNPTKVFIDFMAFIGLAWDRKRATKVWDQRKKRWQEEQGRPVIESLEGPPLFKHRVVTFGPAPFGEDEHDAALNMYGEDDQCAHEDPSADVAEKKVTDN